MHRAHGILKNDALRIRAPGPVKAALRNLGRTEDIKFSPSSRRLAVAGFIQNKVVVLDVDVSASASTQTVTLTDCVQITSSALHYPHGVAFIDDDTIVVANRKGNLSVFELPRAGRSPEPISLTPVQTISGDETCPVSSPGSVLVSNVAPGLHEILVCNNFVHYVTRHVLEGADGRAVRSSEILLRRNLRIPDGIAVNPERRWIAVSNHHRNCVHIYENTPQLDSNSKPDGILRNVKYPHGLRFTPDDQFMLVADAGTPHVHVYARGGDDWMGERDPVSSFRVLGEVTFRRGRYNPQEGGPKGIDIDCGMNVLATTCEAQPLAFFDLKEVLEVHTLPIDRFSSEVHSRLNRLRTGFQSISGKPGEAS